jgi:hypothetical protein
MNFTCIRKVKDYKKEVDLENRFPLFYNIRVINIVKDDYSDLRLYKFINFINL